MSIRDLFSYRLREEGNNVKYAKVIEVTTETYCVRYVDIRRVIVVNGQELPTVRGVFLKPDEFAEIIEYMITYEEHYIISQLRMVWFRVNRYYPNVFELIIKEDVRENKILLSPLDIVQLYMMRELLIIKCYN